MKRITFDIVLFLSAFIFPWWISMPLLFIGVFIFDNFYEFIFVGTVIFILYGSKGESLISLPIFFSTVIVLFFVIIQLIRNNIILYKK